MDERGYIATTNHCLNIRSERNWKREWTLSKDQHWKKCK